MRRGVLLACVMMTSCGDPPEHGRPWAEAERAFRQDPRWLGGDGVMSVALDDGTGPAPRTLWLFGDSFVATSARNVRGESVMVRNSVAIQVGRSLVDSRMTFHWRTNGEGRPASFFPERGAQWHWPRHGYRVPGASLLVWMGLLDATPGEGLGFRHAGTRLVRVENPDAPPPQWTLRWTDVAVPRVDAEIGAASVRIGEHLVSLTPVGDAHRGWLVRHRIDDLVRDEVTRAEWWTGRGWVAQASLVGEPATIMDDAAPESSLHWDPTLQLEGTMTSGAWVHVASRGFGATTIVVRTAPRVEGPWSSPRHVYTPPESREADPFVYAAKAHVAQTPRTPGMLVVTYATNRFDFWSLFRAPWDATRYWPRVVEVDLRAP